MNTVNKMAEANSNKYVYLRAKNYVSIPSPSPVAVFNAAAVNLRAQLAKKNNEKELLKLAATYNRRRKYLSSINKNKSSSIQNAVYDALAEQFGVNIGEIYDLNFDTGGVTININSPSAAIGRLKKVKHAKHKSTNSQSILSRIKKIIELLDELIKVEERTEEKKKLEALDTKVKEFEKIFISLISNKSSLQAAIEALNNAGIKIPSSVSKEKWQQIIVNGKRIDNQSADAFVKILNGIVAAGAHSLLSNITGAFQEYLFLAINLLGDFIANNASDDYIKNALRKAEREAGGKINIGKVTLDGNKEMLKSIQEASKGILVEDGNTKVRLEIEYSSQQKADATITVKNKVYPISVKNYAGFIMKTKGITLQSGTPLTSYLFGNDNVNKNIGAHYLNILASHTDEDAAFNTIKAQGLNTLLLTMLYQSLSGKMLGRGDAGSAEILVVNNNTTGEAIFYDVNTIVSKLSQRGDLLSYKLSNPDLNGIKLKNRKVPANKSRSLEKAIQSRVGGVLNDAYSKKISIMLLPSLIQNVGISPKS